MLKRTIQWVVVGVISALWTTSVQAQHGGWASSFAQGAGAIARGVAGQAANMGIYKVRGELQGAAGSDMLMAQLQQCEILTTQGTVTPYEYQQQCGSLPQLCQEVALQGHSLPPFCMTVLAPFAMQMPAPGPTGMPPPPFYLGIGFPQAMPAPIGAVGFAPGVMGNMSYGNGMYGGGYGMGMMPSPGGMMSPGMMSPMGGYGGGMYGGSMGYGGMYGGYGGGSNMDARSWMEGTAAILADSALGNVQQQIAYGNNPRARRPSQEEAPAEEDEDDD